MPIILKGNRIIIKVGRGKIIQRASIINLINHQTKNILPNKDTPIQEVINNKNHIRRKQSMLLKFPKDPRTFKKIRKAETINQKPKIVQGKTINKGIKEMTKDKPNIKRIKNTTLKDHGQALQKMKLLI